MWQPDSGVAFGEAGKVGCMLLLLLFLCAAFTRPGQAQDSPNVIIIYVDDVGYGDIGAYGSELIPTPEIDQLAASGMRFANAYATASTCTPSRYSLLTGRYAFRNDRARVLNGDAPLLIEPGSITLPEMFRKGGYRTSIIGKWHLGLGEGQIDWNGPIKPGPLEVGFDESFVIPATNDRVPTVYVKGHNVHNLSEKDKSLRVSYRKKIGSLPTGESHPERLRYPADPGHSGTIVNNISRIGWMEGGQSAWWEDEKMADVFAKRSNKFIEANKDQPFFLFLSLHQAHVPRAPNKKFLYQSKAGLRGDVITELDWVVGEVVDKLEELKLRKNTLLIFTSDNGPIYDDGYKDSAISHAHGHEANGPLRGGKYLAYEGGTRVPLIVNWPGRTEAGVSDALVSQVDLLASLSDLAGIDLPADAGVDSHNKMATFLGRENHGRQHIVEQSIGGLSIRKGKWKFVPAETKPAPWTLRKHNARPNPISTTPWPEGDVLYNLKKDPDESINIADQYPGIVKELDTLLTRIKEEPLRRSH